MPTPATALRPANPLALRLWAAGASVAMALTGLLEMQTTLEQRVSARPESFNVFPQEEKLFGAVIPRGIFRNSSLLPVYGSSELTQPQSNRADEFFRHHPTGFGAFLIGNPGETCLMIALKLAAVGPEARGKKVAVFLSPGWFVAPELDHRGFGVNFSALHAGIFAFESPLSAGCKQALARRLVSYSDTVGQSQLLDHALGDIATGASSGRCELALMKPLGLLYDWTLRISDAGKLALWLHNAAQPAKASESGQPELPTTAPIQWQTRLDEVDAAYHLHPLATSYSTGPRTGFDDHLRELFRDPKHPERSPDENFSRTCTASEEWGDLQLLSDVTQLTGCGRWRGPLAGRRTGLWL